MSAEIIDLGVVRLERISRASTLQATPSDPFGLDSVEALEQAYYAAIDAFRADPSPFTLSRLIGSYFAFAALFIPVSAP